MFPFKPKELPSLTKEEIARMLQTTPSAIETFEKAYQENILSVENPHNAKTAAQKHHETDPAQINANLDELIHRIVNELLEKTEVLVYDGNELSVETFMLRNPDTQPVSLQDVTAIPEHLRPQLTGNLLKRDVDGNTAETLLTFYSRFQNAVSPKDKRLNYNMFRQGLDILDLDKITWHILSMNQTAMGNWLPALVDAVKTTRFFKIPSTRIAKVPIPLLQLTRLQYEELTFASREIVNQFCMKAFHLDESKDYFIKTGTFSSKFDFRNAKVTGESEVRTLGEYLLFIQNQAVQMAGGLNGHACYGVSTTNEWVVREFIQDKENNPCIYMGLPLHTEYRAFLDFDDKSVMAVTPYWDPEIMKNAFASPERAGNPHMQHDWITYSAHEPTLMRRYHENVEIVKAELEKILPDFDLTGQYSLDIMQNGDDFYIIDMALAQNSALTHCLKPGSIRPIKENWLPKLN